jgi:hypothetical protein
MQPPIDLPVAARYDAIQISGNPDTLIGVNLEDFNLALVARRLNAGSSCGSGSSSLTLLLNQRSPAIIECEFTRVTSRCQLR